MLCKYVLTVSDTKYELPKSCIQNWDEIKCTLKREDFGGIIMTFTSKFVFAELAYDLLLNEWVDKYLLSDASIEIYEINNLHTYDLLISSKLDFGTFDDSGYTISMSSVDGSTAKIIKANKSTQYEYLVSDIKDSIPLYYDRLPYVYNIAYYLGGRPLENGNQYVGGVSGGEHFMTLPMYIGNSEIVAGSGIEVGDVGASSNLQLCLISSTKEIKVKISIKGEFWYAVSLDAGIQLKTKSGTLLKEWKGGWAGAAITIDWESEVVVSANDGLVLLAYYESKFVELYFTNLDVTLKFFAIGLPINIDVITPSVLLNRLLKSMNGDKEGLTGEIESGTGTSLNLCTIVAAESIRGIPDAKLYTSYTKFVDWMEAVFGYVPIIEGNKVKFVHRDSLFTAEVAKDLGGNHTGLTYSVDEKLIYSSVRVGYEKQDYDSLNGRDEFRFTTEFTTGIDITDNKLELISLYRADAYGFEFLAQKRGKNTTDNESDNDVFFVGAGITFHYEYVNGIRIMILDNWQLLRGGSWMISGVLSPETMFNVMFNQRAMLLANERYIGISTDKLYFASSDGNSDVVINSVKLSDPYIINNRLATCGRISLSTFDEKLPSSMSGTVILEKDGFLYEGYMSEIAYKLEKPDGVKYELIVKSISRL